EPRRAHEHGEEERELPPAERRSSHGPQDAVEEQRGMERGRATERRLRMEEPQRVARLPPEPQHPCGEAGDGPGRDEYGEPVSAGREWLDEERREEDAGHLRHRAERAAPGREEPLLPPHGCEGTDREEQEQRFRVDGGEEEAEGQERVKED